MARPKKLSVESLTGVGAKRLAEILIKASDGDQLIKRALNLELVTLEGAPALARAIRRRLAAIKRAKNYVVDWNRITLLQKDLNLHLDAIASNLAALDPLLAIDLMWEFLDTKTSVFNRVAGQSIDVYNTYTEALRILGELSKANNTDTSKTIKNVLRYVQAEYRHSSTATLVSTIGPTLTKNGQDELKRVLHDHLSGLLARSDSYSCEEEALYVKKELMNLADVQEDVDAYIALIEEDDQFEYSVVVAIASRLVLAKRPLEALKYLEALGRMRLFEDWFDVYIRALEALDRTSDAQKARWDCFQNNLSIDHLRDYLKRLDEVDAFDAEERALDLVLGYRPAQTALSFLLDWRDYRRAAKLVESRVQDFDAYWYEPMNRASEVLAGPQPLAATLLLRSMIDFSLDTGSTKRYKHAAQHLVQCDQLASRITDYREASTHESYLESLHTQHGRKTSFWDHVIKCR